MILQDIKRAERNKNVNLQKFDSSQFRNIIIGNVISVNDIAKLCSVRYSNGVVVSNIRSPRDITLTKGQVVIIGILDTKNRGSAYVLASY